MPVFQVELARGGAGLGPLAEGCRHCPPSFVRSPDSAITGRARHLDNNWKARNLPGLKRQWRAARPASKASASMRPSLVIRLIGGVAPPPETGQRPPDR